MAGRGLTVQPDDVDPSSQPAACASPELRFRMGVNSPRRPSRQFEEPELEKEALQLGPTAHNYYQNAGYAHEDQYAQDYDDPESDERYTDDDESAGVPAGLITQVARPDPSNLVTQVARPDGATSTSTAPATPSSSDSDDDSQPAGWRRLCSCFGFKRRSPKQIKQATNSVPGVTGRDPARKSISRSYSSDDPEGLLPPRLPQHRSKRCLVLDLDETLVHSSFKPVRNPDFVVPVTIENTVHRVYVLKRPGVDEFLQKCAEHYEVIIFTASLSKYADPLLDILDPGKTITDRLFRESCVLQCGTYVKDLELIGRKLKDTIIVDNSPQSYAFQPSNAIPIDSWFDDPNDRQLYELLPFLVDRLPQVSDVRQMLDANKPFSYLIHDCMEYKESYESQH